MTGALDGFGLDDADPAARALTERLQRGLAAVEERLRRDVAVADPILDPMTRYLVEAGGKRTRVALLLLAAELGDGPTDAVLSGAEVVEITHIASLYHDDVMDDAALRRGVPAAHEVWGNSAAILIGDLLFARAGSVGAQLGRDFATLHADTFERMCRGQLHETIGPRDADPIEHYLRVLADKTGSLIAAAAEMGVLLANADPALRQPLREYGEHIGVAFQLVDDVIDLSGSSSTGKQAGTDLRTGVITLPLLRLRAAEDAESRRLLRDLEQPGDDFASAVQRLHDHPASEQTLAEAERWRDGALAALEPVPAGPVRDALERFAGAIVTRSR